MVIYLSAPSNSTLNISKSESYSANAAYGLGPYVFSLFQKGSSTPLFTSTSQSNTIVGNNNGVTYTFSFRPILAGNVSYYVTVNDIDLNATYISTVNTITVNSVMVLYAHGNVINDEARGNTGYWALQNFQRVIKVTQIGLQRYITSFYDSGTANILAGGVSPGNDSSTGEAVFEPANGISTFNGIENFIFNSSISGSPSTSNSFIGTYNALGTASDILLDTYSGQSGDANAVPQQYYMSYLETYLSGNLNSISPANYSWIYSYNSVNGRQNATYSSATGNVLGNIVTYQNASVQIKDFTIPKNTKLNIQSPSTGSTLTVSSTSSGSITANVLISNVTGNFSKTPASASQSLVKIELLNINLSSSGQSSLVAKLTVNYSSSLNSGAIAPYIYNSTSGTWAELSNFSINTTAHTVTFEIPLDPIVGLFTVTNINTGGTPPAAGGLLTGGGGGGGGSGIQSPIVSGSNGAYEVINIAQLDTFHIAFGDQVLEATENFITPTTAGVTLNNTAYVLGIDAPVLVGSNATAQHYLELTQISYLPLEETIALDLYSVFTSPQTTVSNTTSSTTTTVNTTTVSTSIVTTTINQIVSYPNSTGLGSQSLSVPPGTSTAVGVVVVLAVIVVAAAYLHKRMASKQRKSK